MSKPPTTPYHLLRRGTSSPSNVSSAFTTLALGTHRGAAVVASAGIGMGLGTAAATGVASSPWNLAYLAAVPTGGVSALPILVKSRTPSPSPSTTMLARNRVPTPSSAMSSTKSASLRPIPLRRLTTSSRTSTPLVQLPQNTPLPHYRLPALSSGDGDYFGTGYDQHRTGVHLAPATMEDPSHPLLPRIGAPAPTSRALETRPRRRVWDLRARQGHVRWDSFESEVKRRQSVHSEVGVAAGYDGFTTVSLPSTTTPHTEPPSATFAYGVPLNASASASAPTPEPEPGKPPTTSPSSSSPRHEPHYILNASASGIPKQRHQTPSPRSPHPSDPLTSTTAIQVGEDAYYICPESLGISDGVGGWSSARRKRQQRRVVRFDEDGGRVETMVEGEGDADPGRFSRLLMHFCEREVEEWRSGRRRPKLNEDGTPVEPGKSTLDPVEIMQKGYEKCIECVQTEGIFGSATCLVAVLTDNQLRVANLGDCAIVVIRRGEIVFRTEEMQHSFNFPLQLGTNSRDEPMKDAEYYEVQVEKGDIVVMCSDGLSDNLFDEDILDIIASHTPPSTSDPKMSDTAQPHALSEALCKAAQDASEETGSASPFMCRAIEEGLDFMGGKKDDISVLVAVVTDRDELKSVG